MTLKKDKAYEMLSEASRLQRRAYEILAQDKRILEETEQLDNLAIQAISTPELKTGTLIMDKYRVCTALGMNVYMITDLDTDRIYLVKVGMEGNSLLETGFEVSKDLADIEGIPRPVEKINYKGKVFVLYEYIPGENFAITTPRNVKKAMIELCRIVREVHKRGYIHRDIKPSNIILDMQGHVHLIDFDIAVKKNGTGGAVIEQAMGTPKYAPPEAYKSNGTIQQNVDIYSIGCVYRELVGRQSESRKVIERATESDPEKRYQSIDEMLEDLLPDTNEIQKLGGE